MPTAELVGLLIEAPAHDTDIEPEAGNPIGPTADAKQVWACTRGRKKDPTGMVPAFGAKVKHFKETIPTSTDENGSETFIQEGGSQGGSKRHRPLG